MGILGGGGGQNGACFVISGYRQGRVNAEERVDNGNGKNGNEM